MGGLFKIIGVVLIFLIIAGASYSTWYVYGLFIKSPRDYNETIDTIVMERVSKLSTTPTNAEVAFVVSPLDLQQKINYQTVALCVGGILIISCIGIGLSLLFISYGNKLNKEKL